MKTKKIILMIFSMLFLMALLQGAECNLTQVITPTSSPSAGATDTPETNPLEFNRYNVTYALVAIIDQISYYSIYVAIIFTLYGAVMYITSIGNDEKIGKAKNILTWSVVGFIVILASYAIIHYVLRQITG